MTLDEAFIRLANREVLSCRELNRELLDELTAYGLIRLEGKVVIAPPCELLSARILQEALDAFEFRRDVKVEVCTVIESTNTALLDRTHTESIDGTVLLAEVQTGGRGRRGRAWLSPFAQNLAFSVGLELDTPAAKIGAISLAFGVAITEELEKYGIGGVGLKWPNDLLIKQHKTGGILVELVDAGQPLKLVVGVGVNVFAAPTLDSHAAIPTTSLAQHAANVSRNEAAGCIVKAVLEAAESYERYGFGPFHSRWNKRNAYRGRDLTVSSTTEQISGTDLGVNGEGALRLATSDGIKTIIGGDVSIRVR